MTTAEIVQVFNRQFSSGYATRLIGGAAEPFYRAASSEFECHEIQFRSDYASSALHEIAHWCIAGVCRRQQDDYGYLYVENRDARQQVDFTLLESKPQALEWIFSIASDVEFRVSCDNFDESSRNLVNLRTLVRRKARYFIEKGLPHRAVLFADALAGFTGILDYSEAFQFQDLPK
jgi:elongation factor P hydroxylase